jgi:hypothetical protein
VVLGAGLITLACDEPAALTPSDHAFAVAPEIVTGISVHGPSRRLEAARGDTAYPFTFRFADGTGRDARRCPETPRLRSALSRLMSIPVVAAVDDAEAERVLGTVADHDWVALEVRDTIQNVDPLQLRILPAAPARPRIYAKVPRGPYFITDANLLEVLNLGCE